MSRKVQKRLKRIEKNEEKERKILTSQKKELTKALQETDKMLDVRQRKLDKTVLAEEQKIEDEIQKLTNVKLTDLYRPIWRHTLAHFHLGASASDLRFTQFNVYIVAHSSALIFGSKYLLCSKTYHHKSSLSGFKSLRAEVLAARY